MSYAQLITALKAGLVSAGLTENPDPREDSLANASRGAFDGSFLIVPESGAEPWPEAAKATPSHWKGILRVEVATTLTTSVVSQSETVEQRARLFFEKCVYGGLSAGEIYQWEPPTTSRNFKDKRIIWSIRIFVRWTE